MAERLSVIKFRASENGLSEAALVAGMQKILELALYKFGGTYFYDRSTKTRLTMRRLTLAIQTNLLFLLLFYFKYL